MSDERQAFELQVPAEPTLGVTVRVFVTEAARRLGLGDADVDDLRLAATELLANAVESSGSALELTLRVDSGRWYLRATGAGTLSAASDDMIDRGDVLRALAEVREDDGSVEVSSDVTPTDLPR